MRQPFQCQPKVQVSPEIAWDWQSFHSTFDPIERVVWYQVRRLLLTGSMDGLSRREYMTFNGDPAPNYLDSLMADRPGRSLPEDWNRLPSA